MSVLSSSYRPVPVGLWLALGVLAVMQVAHVHFNRSDLQSDIQQLSTPLHPDLYSKMALGSDRLFSYLLLLDLQLHDNQTGRHLRYEHLDYTLLVQWLRTVYALNPESDYPAFIASRVYSNVNDERKIRLIIDVIEDLFAQDPARHWRRMTEACLLAKHKLKDLPRALDLAEQVAALPNSIRLPYWARDMRIILLDELNELESARILISSLLESGEIEDPDEIHFLQQRLLKIQQSLLEQEQSS